MKFPLAWLLFEKWLWITILGCIAIVIFPLVIVYGIFYLPVEGKVAALFTILGGWGIAGGYKDYAMSKRKEKEREKVRALKYDI